MSYIDGFVIAVPTHCVGDGDEGIYVAEGAEGYQQNPFTPLHVGHSMR